MVLMTGNGRSVSPPAVEAAGTTEIVEKPFPANELFEAVTRGAEAS